MSLYTAFRQSIVTGKGPIAKSAKKKRITLVRYILNDVKTNSIVLLTVAL